MATVAAAAAAATCIRVRCDDGDGMFSVVGLVCTVLVFMYYITVRSIFAKIRHTANSTLDSNVTTSTT